jgi:hypothetical protein
MTHPKSTFLHVGLSPKDRTCLLLLSYTPCCFIYAFLEVEFTSESPLITFDEHLILNCDWHAV